MKCLCMHDLTICISTTLLVKLLKRSYCVDKYLDAVFWKLPYIYMLPFLMSYRVVFIAFMKPLIWSFLFPSNFNSWKKEACFVSKRERKKSTGLLHFYFFFNFFFYLHYLPKCVKHLHTFVLLDGYYWSKRRIVLYGPGLAYEQSWCYCSVTYEWNILRFTFVRCNWLSKW